MWSHPKYKDQFKSSYVKTKNDRVFQLSNGKRVISFESWQQAKVQGWVKS